MFIQAFHVSADPLRFGQVSTDDTCLHVETFTTTVATTNLHFLTSDEVIPRVAAGLLRFGNVVTDDVCLYAETFVFKVVNDTGSLSEANRGRITTGLEYYFGAFGDNVTLNEVINEARTHKQSHPLFEF